MEFITIILIETMQKMNYRTKKLKAQINIRIFSFYDLYLSAVCLKEISFDIFLKMEYGYSTKMFYFLGTSLVLIKKVYI